MSSQAREVENGQQALRLEKGHVDIDESGKLSTSALKLDKHGLPLVPQPSDHKDDPLVSRSSQTTNILTCNKFKQFLILHSRIGLLH